MATTWIRAEWMQLHVCALGASGGWKLAQLRLFCSLSSLCFERQGEKRRNTLCKLSLNTRRTETMFCSARSMRSHGFGVSPCLRQRPDRVKRTAEAPRGRRGCEMLGNGPLRLTTDDRSFHRAEALFVALLCLCQLYGSRRKFKLSSQLCAVCRVVVTPFFEINHEIVSTYKGVGVDC